MILENISHRLFKVIFCLRIGQGCNPNHSSEAQGRALSAILAISCLHKKPPTPSLYLSHIISCLKEPQQTEEKPPPIVSQLFLFFSKIII